MMRDEVVIDVFDGTLPRGGWLAFLEGLADK